MNTTTDEQTFLRLADERIERLEATLERLVDEDDIELDVELKPGGVIELECSNGSKIIINRHTAAREIWIAARSGGYHFAFDGQNWTSGRDGSEFLAVLSRCIAEQTGQKVVLDDRK
jgi:CyaY protein